ncbi:MAG TPA: SCO family protein [Rhizomicrobium sp.]|nr:SCO family protein [Rhizomicrobium sp.]
MHLPRFAYGPFLALCLAAAACGRATEADTTDISGVMPPLSFSMVRANDGAPVNAASYRGKVVLLYFGYTHCPDECPTTLTNLAVALKRIGPDARDVRVLFVTVDPARDSILVLKKYVNAFDRQIDGLRGSDNAIAALARRYRVLYAVTPAAPGRAYDVMHADSLFMFDRSGRARLVTTSTENAAALAAEIKALG